MSGSCERSSLPVLAAPRVVFNWELHVACNYRCPYCWFDGHWHEYKASNRYHSVDKIVSVWEDIHRRYGTCAIRNSGGEPTAYPGFDEIVARTCQWHKWSICTNLSGHMDRWRALYGRIRPERLEIAASFHPQMAVLNEFLAKVLWLQKQGVAVCVLCTAYPANLSDIRRYSDAFVQNDIGVEIIPFNGLYGGRRYPASYTADERKWIYKANADSASPALDRLDYAMDDSCPYGKPCHAGRLYCSIDREGNVSRCAESSRSERGVLGNLFTGFSLLQDPAPCPMNHCQAETEWLVEKRPADASR